MDKSKKWKKKYFDCLYNRIEYWAERNEKEANQKINHIQQQIVLTKGSISRTKEMKHNTLKSNSSSKE